ncbi:glycosyltransferase [Jiella mangrovi]|uniref:glycosyltransferase n=1 Tax=Jiella mangrovi TaxID=2821407 RepID=UPI001AE44461|nr:glycosyltransferase [Jiella mangrovi]
MNPSAVFDTHYYRNSNDDVREVDVNPLDHFIRWGQFEGRKSRPQDDVNRILSELGRTVFDLLSPHAEREFYFRQTGHEFAHTVDPVLHYFAWGHQLGISISPKFDPQFYRDTNYDIRHYGIEPLIHYAEYGWREGRLSAKDTRLVPVAPEFAERAERVRSSIDPKRYYEQLPYLKDTTVDPALHYILFGDRHGLDPNDGFSVHFYRSKYPDRHGVLTTLERHLAYRGRDPRITTPTSGPRLRSAKASPQALAIHEKAEGLRAWSDPQTPDVYVLIPIYKGYDETLSSIRAAAVAKTVRPFKIAVLDDCSPDAELSEAAARLCAEIGALYHRHETNRGFVGNINFGFETVERIGASHVILLNADTVVHDFWIDLMLARLERETDVATITPLSNNATILSYPVFCSDNNYELEIDHAALAGLARESSVNSVELITGVGFAMLISQEALRQLGHLDETAFKRGYGEEVDFCQRARQAGLRNICAPDVFVTHLGAVSFAELHVEHHSYAQRVLGERYPTYHLAVQDFIHGDPMLPARRELDMARLVHAIGDAKFMLSIEHKLGGGIGHYVEEFRNLGFSSGQSLVCVSVETESHCSIRLFQPTGELSLPNLGLVHFDDLEGLMARLQGLATCQGVVFNSMMGAGTALRQLLSNSCAQSSKPLVTVVHDYSFICPRANLVNAINEFCGGEQENSVCRDCIHKYRPQMSIEMAEWKRVHRAILDASRTIILPNPEVARYFGEGFLDPSRVVVRQHFEPDLMSVAPAARPAMAAGRKRRLALIGALGPHKGSRLVVALRDTIETLGLDLELHVVGYLDFQDVGNGTSCFVHGLYADDEEALGLLREIEPDAALSLSIWPETYCYSLSLAMALEIPTFGFDIGAQGERLRRYERGLLLDPSMKDRIVELARLLDDRDLATIWQKPVNRSQHFASYASIGDYLAHDEHEEAI